MITYPQPGHSRPKVQARSAVPFAVELLPGFQVDGTWNVPTTLTFQVDGTWNVPTTLTFVSCVNLARHRFGFFRWPIGRDLLQSCKIVASVT